MGTTNFRNHENGIFVIPQTSFEQMKELMEEDEFFEPHREGGLTDEDVYEQLAFEEERNAEEFLEHQLGYQLKEKGFTVTIEGDRWNEVMHVFRGEKKLAELYLEAGYYSGAQVIVETDPYKIIQDDDLFYNDRIEDYQEEFVKSKLNEVYTPHNKTLFKVITSCTDAYSLDGVFSDGTGLYSKL